VAAIHAAICAASRGVTAPAPAARIAVAGVVTLILLELLWELVLAPLTPGGSWLALKALPLVGLAPGVLRGVRRTRQWLALLLPFYVAEALVRALVEPGRHAFVAATTCAVATIAFIALLRWLRAESPRHREHRSLDDA
jgi:uncharacterized membrane protein